MIWTPKAARVNFQLLGESRHDADPNSLLPISTWYSGEYYMSKIFQME